MEHFYQNIDSENWFDYQNLYKKVIVDCPVNSHFVEVGTWKGMSACFMAVEIINSGKNIKFDCVDTWEYIPTSSEITEEQCMNLYEIFLENITPVKDVITPIKALSWDGASYYEDGSLDFVFIDAGHEYKNVIKDIRAWYPKVKPGGIISGHDYHWDCGVYTAVNEFFSGKPIKQMGACWLYDKNVL